MASLLLKLNTSMDPVSQTKHIYFRKISKVEYPPLVATTSSHRYMRTLQLTNQVFFLISSGCFI